MNGISGGARGEDLYCSVCGVQFSSVSNRNRHIRTAHTEEKHTCEVCGFETTRTDNFTRHREKHPILNHGGPKKKRKIGLRQKRTANTELRNLVDFAAIARAEEEEERIRKKYSSNIPMTLEQEYEEIARMEKLEKILEKRRQEEAERLVTMKLEKEKEERGAGDDDDEVTNSQ